MTTKAQIRILANVYDAENTIDKMTIVNLLTTKRNKNDYSMGDGFEGKIKQCTLFLCTY